MALNSVLFGDFSETEVEDLFSGGTRDLEFVWQEGLRSAGSRPPDGLTPPPGAQLVDDETAELSLASVHILDIPEDLPRPVYGSATASPIYPPNPPTTPEPPTPPTLSKLNANAAAFVPKFLINDSRNNLAASPAKDQHGNVVGSNNKHVKAPLAVAAPQTGETLSHSAGSTPGISPSGTPVKQPVRDVSSPSADHIGLGLSAESPLPGVSVGVRSVSPGGQEIQMKVAEGPTVSSPASTPAQRGQTPVPVPVPVPAAESLTREAISSSSPLPPQTQPNGGSSRSSSTCSSSNNSVRTTEDRSRSVQSPQAHGSSTGGGGCPQQQTGHSGTLSPTSSQVSLASSSGQRSSSSLSDSSHPPAATPTPPAATPTPPAATPTPSDATASTVTSCTSSPTTTTITASVFPAPTTTSAPTASPTAAPPPPTPPSATTAPIPLSTLLTPAKPKSWASIVGGSISPATASPSVLAPPPVPGSAVAASGQKGGPGVAGGGGAPSEGSKEGAEALLDPSKCSSQLRSLGEQLKGVTVSHETVNIQPRGLINPGNWCYIHAPLQALLGCPGVYHLLRGLNPYPALSREPSATPLTDSMVQFVHEFEPYPKTATAPAIDASPVKPGPKKKRSSSRPEFLHMEPFKPDYVYQMLQKIKSNLSYKGRQEDAEEFLGRVLDGLHEEIVSAKKALEEGSEEKGGASGDDVEDGGEGEGEGEEQGEWEQVGPKNKSTITRQTTFSESPITEIFGGELRSAVHRQGAKESATMEPFFSLQLDIQSEDIWTVKEALDALAVREIVQEIEAQKRITLARLPPVLILHLKRFIFDKTGGSQKLQKQVQYSIELEIGKDLLAPAVKSKLTLAQRSYRLWAVVYHHGKFATGGHYTCDVYHPSCGGWVRMDDSIVKAVPEDMVLKSGQGSIKVAYLLFYRRLDLVRTA